MRITYNHLHEFLRERLDADGEVDGFTTEEILAFMNRHFDSIDESKLRASGTGKPSVVIAHSGIFCKIDHDGVIGIYISMPSSFRAREPGIPGAQWAEPVTKAGPNHFRDMLAGRLPYILSPGFVTDLMVFISGLFGNPLCDCRKCTERRKLEAESDSSCSGRLH